MTSLVVGVSGATCSGKTTLATLLHKLFICSSHLNQDLYYWEELSEKHRHFPVLLPQGELKEVINWELLSAFDMAKLAEDIRALKNKKMTLKNPKTIPKTWIMRSYSSADIFVDERGSVDLQFRKEFLDEIAPIRSVPLIFVEGILLFNDKAVADLCDMKHFLTLDYETSLSRRKTRTYDPPDIEGYFDQVVWPWYNKNMESLEMSQATKVTFFDGRNSLAKNFTLIFNDLLKLLLRSY